MSSTQREYLEKNIRRMQRERDEAREDHDHERAQVYALMLVALERLRAEVKP
jgi:hypothetical protein